MAGSAPPRARRASRASRSCRPAPNSLDTPRTPGLRARRSRSRSASLAARLADDRPAARGRLVQAAYGCRVRRPEKDLRVVLGLAEDRIERVGQVVEGLARLGLGRLD